MFTVYIQLLFFKSLRIIKILRITEIVEILSEFNFYPLEVVSRYRDPQLQVGKITYICLIFNHTFSNIDV